MREKITLFLLKGVAHLPLRMLYAFSEVVYFLVYHVIGYRRKVVRQNLLEAFPEKSERELKKIEREYYHFLCDTIVETLKLLHISDKELQKRVTIENAEIVNRSIAEGRSAVLMLAHYGNWEWVQEITRDIAPEAYKASIYHALKDPVWDRIFLTLRGRWGSHIINQNRAPKALLNRGNMPWVCGFIADHRPLNREHGNIVPFLNHHTSFVYGPEVIGRKIGADFFFLEMQRPKRGRYVIKFHPLTAAEGENPYPVTREFWRLLEEVIRKNPALWLWSHKRWKKDKLIT